MKMVKTQTCEVVNPRLTIWKFRLIVQDEQHFAMPAGAKVLCVQMQNNQACLWVLVDKEARLEDRYFRIFGTGHDVSGAGRYIGSFQMHHGALVFHVFEAE